MKIAVFSYKIDEVSVRVINLLVALAEEHNFEVGWEEKTLQQARKLKSFAYHDSNETFGEKKGLDASTHLFFAFGGDGTVLRAQMFIGKLEIPLVGINTGRLGFLAYFTLEQFTRDCMIKLLKGNFKVDKRSLLEVSFQGDEVLESKFALNELTVARKETSSMIVVDVLLNEEHLNSYWADGLILATPTGSTGYSLSCGGPIVSPDNDTFIITPVAPHNLFVRPFIISDDISIKLRVDSRSDQYILTLDTKCVSLPKETLLEVKKAPYFAHIVKFEAHSYLHTLREKLFWGQDKRNS